MYLKNISSVSKYISWINYLHKENKVAFARKCRMNVKNETFRAHAERAVSANAFVRIYKPTNIACVAAYTQRIVKQSLHFFL